MYHTVTFGSEGKNIQMIQQNSAAMVFPMTQYENKSWTLNKQDRKNIESFEF